jgi:chemotaxis protein histidine kinase CheA
LPLEPRVTRDVSDDFAPEELQMLRSFFRDEANEVLEQLTSRLLQLGADAPGPDAMSELMRTTHTLKGSAGTVGLGHIVELAHALEDRFAHVRSGRLPWSRDALDCFVDAVDALRALCDDVEESSGQDLLTERVTERLQRLGSLSRSSTSDPAPSAEGAAELPAALLPAAERSDAELDFDRLAPARPSASDGVPAFAAPADDGGDHTLSIVAAEMSGIHALPPEAAAPTTGGRVLRVDAARLDGLMDSAGELVFDRTRIERRVQRVRTIIRDLGRMRQRARDQMAALRRAKSDEEREQVLDTFRELEGELARSVALIARSTGALLDDTESLRRTSTAIQEGLTRMRMLSAGALFQRLAPPLRTIARAAGKRIKLKISGGDTEFDKTVAEQIIDALVQLLRNAVAHGIESEEERKAAGKSPEGRIEISARQSGGLIIIEVSDDGAGIDPAALRERFVQSARWTRARADLASEEDVLRAIFDSGMSSRDEADALAGRGVGLDAVRETISRLGGEVRLTSTPGKGTTFVLRLPVSTALSQSMLIKVLGQVYAVPNIHVVETSRVDVALGQLAEYLELRGEQLPVVALHEALGGEIPFDSDSLPALVIEYLGKRFAITCDKLIGPRQIVVKDLGPLLAPLPLFAGATISGSGKVQLILDTDALLRLAHPESSAAEPTQRVGMADTDLAGRALVADDSRAIREAMTRMLAREGYIVDVAENGARAWDMLREISYDIVLTDLEMPELDGFGLIERMRATAQLAHTPVIIISSRANAGNRKRAGDLDVSTFIAKPITRTKLTRALDLVLR